MEEAEGYKARVVAQAQGDSQRFRLIQTEHAKAPQVTRERLYIETMQEIYSNVTKVMVDTRQNSNLLYLPLDKIMQSTGASAPPMNAGGVSSAPASAAAATPPADPRTRDDARARTRETR
jgi:membrane protease subunit HflK